MSSLQKSVGTGTGLADAPPPIYIDARRNLAEHFLFGRGLEIGPLHQPLHLPPHVTVRYVDRMKEDELREEYPELADWNLTPVDVVDDGETLSTIPAESQDFIVANHFLEHCENPIGTIETHFSKLRPGGLLFYAVPDKRFTFDSLRPLTPLEHMVADYEQGPERSRAEHYAEWVRLVIDEGSGLAPTDPKYRSEEWEATKTKELEEESYSIHMHVWTQVEFLKLILECRRRLDIAFDIEATARQGIEFMVVLRRQGAFPKPTPPPPPEPPPPPPPPPLSPEEIAVRNLLHLRVRRALGAARREFRKTEA